MKSKLNRIFLCVGLGVMLFVYFKFGKSVVEDNRLDVAAIHSCYFNSYGDCAGTCNVGYYCTGSSSCSCVKSPTSCSSVGSATECGYIPGCYWYNNSCSSTAPTTIILPTRVPTAVPTAVICDCALGVDYCVNDCISPGVAIVRCYPSSSCVGLVSPCSIGPYDVGLQYCPASGPTPTSYCHPISCTDVCGLGCPDGCGSRDNCGGVSCSNCDGSDDVVPTSAPVDPVCSPSCASDPCISSTCSDAVCLGVCGSYCYGILSCSTPVITGIDIENGDGDVVPPTTVSDGVGGTMVDGRNNNCETTFYESALPQRVGFSVTVTDADGYTNISTVEVRWNGNVYPLSLSSGLGNTAIYTRTVDFTAADYTNGVYPFEIRVTDANARTTGWVDSGRSWKFWDCMVEVNGSLYDGSSGQACTNVGFTTLMDETSNLSSLLFQDMGASDDVVMTVTVPNSFGTDYLIWGKNYLPIFNGGSLANPDGDLAGTGRMTRIVDVGTGATSCPVATQFNIGSYVSPYVAVPEAKIDMSFVQDQEGWFQVAGAGVKARLDVALGVPATMGVTERALSIDGLRAKNGLVSGSSFSNINGFNDESIYGIPNNWRVERNTNDSTFYSYQYFYNNFLIKSGIGITGTDWTGHPSEGVYFVNGDLTIDSDFAIAANTSLIVVVKGKITIDESVSRVDGIYISDGGIEALGTSADQLVIGGMLYSRGNIRLGRSFADPRENNTTPPVKVFYNSNLIFNMPGKLMRVLSGWTGE